MMEECGPKHVVFGLLKHYCYSDELYAFVGLHCGKWIIMHGMENIKKIISSWNIFSFVIIKVDNISIILKLVHLIFYDISILSLPTYREKEVQEDFKPKISAIT